MKFLMALLFTLLMAPVSALATSATMSKLWEWFVAAEYGPGPSYGAWYGVSLIAGVVLAGALTGVATEKMEVDKAAGVLFWRAVGLLLVCGLVLAVAWAIGGITGWRA